MTPGASRLSGMLCQSKDDQHEKSICVWLRLTARNGAQSRGLLQTRRLEIPIDGSSVCLGRASGNALKNMIATPDNGYFDCAVISREHAFLTAPHGRWGPIMLTDNSLHGTTVNHKKLEKGDKTELKAHDKIKFGVPVSRLDGFHDGIEVTITIDRNIPTYQQHISQATSCTLQQSSGRFTVPESLSDNLSDEDLHTPCPVDYPYLGSDEEHQDSDDDTPSTADDLKQERLQSSGQSFQDPVVLDDDEAVERSILPAKRNDEDVALSEYSEPATKKLVRFHQKVVDDLSDDPASQDPEADMALDDCPDSDVELSDAEGSREPALEAEKEDNAEISGGAARSHCFSSPKLLAVEKAVPAAVAPKACSLPGIDSLSVPADTWHTAPKVSCPQGRPTQFPVIYELWPSPPKPRTIFPYGSSSYSSESQNIDSSSDNWATGSGLGWNSRSGQYSNDIPDGTYGLVSDTVASTKYWPSYDPARDAVTTNDNTKKMFSASSADPDTVASVPLSDDHETSEQQLAPVAKRDSVHTGEVTGVNTSDAEEKAGEKRKRVESDDVQAQDTQQVSVQRTDETACDENPCVRLVESNTIPSAKRIKRSKTNGSSVALTAVAGAFGGCIATWGFLMTPFAEQVIDMIP